MESATCSLPLSACLCAFFPSCDRPETSGALGGDGGMSFVPPGQHDKYYSFYSGGHSGQVFVAGLPSLRHIVTIPVFAPSPGKGYGFDDKSRAMLAAIFRCPT